MDESQDPLINSQSNIPQSSSRSCKLKSSAKWIQKIQKYLCPKSIRLKLFAVFMILLLTVFMFYLSCLASSSFSPLCVSYVPSPDLRLINRNKTFGNFAQHQHLPHCIIIGIRKAGTRALLNYLALHPDIVTAGKEMHFFDLDENYMRGLEYYRKQMPLTQVNQITMEKTPAYFTEIMVPERIYRMNSTIKLVLIVREPVTRLISDYTQLSEQRIKRNKTPIPFELEVLDKYGDVDMSYKPVQSSIYYAHMRRWLDFFPWEQILIVDGDHLVKDPFDEVYKVESFLGVRHAIHKENFTFNSTKGFFCMNKNDTPSCLPDTKGRKHAHVDEKLLKKLYKFYEPRNKVFFQLINRTFNWERPEFLY